MSILPGTDRGKNPAVALSFTERFLHSNSLGVVGHIPISQMRFSVVKWGHLQTPSEVLSLVLSMIRGSQLLGPRPFFGLSSFLDSASAGGGEGYLASSGPFLTADTQSSQPLALRGRRWY